LRIAVTGAVFADYLMSMLFKLQQCISEQVIFHALSMQDD
jgi:hypothetical protein